MKEVEILVEVFDAPEEVLHKLNVFPFKGKKKTIDEYFFDPLRNNLAPNADFKLLECCRLRTKGDKFTLTYKVDHYKGEEWNYSDEFETEVSNYETTKEILTKLGLETLIIIDNDKYIFETGDYEVVLEVVKNLGIFLEVECLVIDELSDVDFEKQKIREFIETLGIACSKELNSGKPELLLRKNWKS